MSVVQRQPLSDLTPGVFQRPGELTWSAFYRRIWSAARIRETGKSMIQFEFIRRLTKLVVIVKEISLPITFVGCGRSKI